MQNSKIISSAAHTAPIDEQILVIRKSTLFKDITSWYGIDDENYEEIIEIIQNQGLFASRTFAETNFDLKQIIPYVIFTVNKKIFVMERKKSASEQRLASKLSIGIGGHMRQEDVVRNDVIAWAKREFHEEVSYSGAQEITILGILNDDSNDVGKVHLGIVLLVQGDSENIAIKDEHKSGTLYTLQECKALFDRMESWSQLCLGFVTESKLI